MADIVVLGAGLSGLACAGALVRAGRDVVVLEKARGVGGRCATRRIEGQAVDHGLGFLHGTDPEFLAAIDGVRALRVPGWPRVVSGQGTPCHPAAFDPATRRLAFADGVNVLAKHLAQGLDVRLKTKVTAIELAEGAVTVTADNGERHTAPTLVLALPVEQSAALLDGIEALAPARALLGTVRTHPCWTVIARYDGPDDALDAEIVYPAGGALQLVAHDSSKRPHPRVRTLVLQARPSWSARHLADPPEHVVAALVAEASEQLGPWAAAPVLTVAHRWRYARMDRGAGLAAPYLVALPGGARIGIAGEAFDPVGGAEAAFRSGRRLARRIAGGGTDE
ncbi:MAG: FAD-dependent oxidoreductase [Pseudomonadota bacterium]|nr:FAD-dependent oxidoreductase [Pseudomonadota bacterium]